MFIHTYILKKALKSTLSTVNSQFENISILFRRLKHRDLVRILTLSDVTRTFTVPLVRIDVSIYD